MSSRANQPDQLQVRDLGRMTYEPALAIQRQVHEAVLAGEQPQTLLLVEHDPVITVSQRRGANGHVIAPPKNLRELGIDVQPTDRGGDVTYHGPGQLVAYPILRLAPLHLNISSYMRLLEQIVIDTVATYGIVAGRDKCATGVWIDTGNAKLCAMGVRVRKNVTMHGLALNVCPDMSHFQTIVPCGLVGRAVTSMQTLMGETCPSMATVKTTLVAQFQSHLNRLAQAAASGNADQ